MNSSFPSTPVTDWSYAILACEALAVADSSLRGKESPYFATYGSQISSPFDGLKKIAEDMKSCIPHKPTYNSLDVPVEMSEVEMFAHRKPVWNILSIVMNEVSPFENTSTQKKAEIVLFWIEGLRLHEEYSRLEAEFLAKLEVFGILSISVYEGEKETSLGQKNDGMKESLSERFDGGSKEFLIKFAALAAERLDEHFRAINQNTG
jgi:hypothetical protein